MPLDKYDNVEQVRIAPAAGEYRIVVLAQYTDPEVPVRSWSMSMGRL
ncbi:MAG TPA: hypothetical protein VGO40_13750 [Longimicrobium sp.]|nr:hypothetical protein [Longimicrobium sp.]